MSEKLDKLRLADRAEAIIRRDRHAIEQVRRGPRADGLLLALGSNVSAVADLWDRHIPQVAEAAGLGYVRLVATGRREVPEDLIARAVLVLADLAGRDEDVVTLVYQTFGDGRRILLAGGGPADIPRDLADVPSVFYDLEGAQVQPLLDEIRRWSSPLQVAACR